MPKQQTCITCTASQMVTAELHYGCIMHSFLTEECHILVKLSERGSFHLFRQEAGRRAVCSLNLEEIILNFVADKLESSTKAVAYQVGVTHQIVCRVLNEITYTPSVVRKLKL